MSFQIYLGPWGQSRSPSWFDGEEYSAAVNSAAWFSNLALFTGKNSNPAKLHHGWSKFIGKVVSGSKPSHNIPGERIAWDLLINLQKTFACPDGFVETIINSQGTSCGLVSSSNVVWSSTRACPSKRWKCSWVHAWICSASVAEVV